MIARLKRLLESRFRISAQLHLAIWSAVALTIAASLVGWFFFNRVGDFQSRVNEGSIPEMAAAFGVAQYSGTLVAAAPRLTAAATTEEFDQVALSIEEAYRAFEEQLALLEEGGSGEEIFAEVRTLANGLIANIGTIQSDKNTFFTLEEQTEALGKTLTELRDQLDHVVIPAIDDQLFFTMTGYRALGEPPTPRFEHFSEEEFDNYRHLAQLQTDSNVAMELLANAFTLSDPSLIEPLRERFEAAASRIDRDLAALAESPVQAEVTPILVRLFELGVGEQNGFDLLAQRLLLAERQQDLLQHNQDMTINLVGQVDGLVNAARARAQEAAQATSQAIFSGRTLLLIISGISIAGAMVIAWIFVGRILIRRLNMLSEWMRRMAGGDLEARVEMEGRDEVADMAAALEVFRRHALEVQRLNLVEKLAEELSEKNEQLESVLADLHRAQDQIVMREKLAALGELTAGVAHEIRNPLNFVKNFSAVSEELLTELQEALDEESTKLPAEQRELIEEICLDLNGNLERIGSHGERANRIVHDMLLMGRDSGELQVTNINNLLDEHARLAYHSARATDPDFQLDLRQNLNPDMGELEVIPQELGRVFLNMVSNACYATDEKRRSGDATDENGGPYMPTVWLSTHRDEDHAKVVIRDNGSGVPPDVIDKIFNPFFTTKPTDQGTGLGLSMCSDIVRRHGGTIRVQSEPEQFTEMTIELPLEPPPATEEDEEPSDAP
ncbi:MAG: ATP-binding protein [Actinomycetia bacterium]|nr:ATP-binding protein [Actinomycetes bacterium]